MLMQRIIFDSAVKGQTGIPNVIPKKIKKYFIKLLDFS